MTVASIADRIGQADAHRPPPGSNGVAIAATPFAWRDPKSIPARPWVYGRWLLRNTITAVVAPGGVGKSSLMATTILALATGRALLGKTIWEGPQRVWYWNLEDDGDELSRQIHAAALHHHVGQNDCGDRLFVDSGLDGATLCVATEDQDGFKILHPVVEALVAELIGRRMDVLIVDPFVSSHTVSENDNGAVDAVAKEWARVAKRANCAIVLVHHTKKLGGQKVTAEMSRGAVALINAARIALVLNRMDTEEATRFGIADDGERRRHFNVQDDKHNRAPAEDAEWYRMASVDLGNGEGIGAGDNIGVVARWTPPDTFDGVTTEHLRQVQRDVDAGEWRKSDQSPEWVGQVVARVLELDLNKITDKARVKRLLREWTTNGMLVEETRKDGRGNARPFIVVGRWADDHSTPPHQQVRNGEEVGTPFPTTTAPKRAVGGGEERPADVARRPKMILAPGETGDEPIPGWEEFNGR
ncbi:AAA family ATPase [Sphingomonas sp.]|uniref:AAA family ATPase n=1 Tax=Sphingomonas sp. TaxID=28214 RepID=UPI0035C87D1C